jgi:hypothetical protein
MEMIFDLNICKTKKPTKGKKLTKVLKYEKCLEFWAQTEINTMANNMETKAI